MVYLYYVSIAALLGSVLTLLYDWQNNRPKTIRGTFIDNGDFGLFLRPDNNQSVDIPVRLANGLQEELKSLTNSLNGINGLFLTINQYILVCAVGMTTVLSYDDFKLRSPYMTPNAVYWLGLPAAIIIFFQKTFKNDITDPFFFVPLVIFSALMVYIWIFIYLLKAKFISWQADQFVDQFECMRRSAAN